MDSIFLLSDEARSRFFRSAARVLRCSYICLWSPLRQYPLSISFLICKDGWHHEEDGEGPSSPASSSKRLFDAYRSSLCSIQYCSCVPGLAYKCNLPYIELSDSNLIDLASVQVQRKFYQEAGIKTAIFLRCTSGEIEFGMTTSTDYASMHSTIQKIFSEEFIQQPQLGDQKVASVHSRPSSSSTSPLRVENHYSSLPHHVLATQAFGGHRNHLPSSARDEAAVAQAILAVISSSTSPSSSASAVKFLGASSSSSSSRRDRGLNFLGAFRPYNHAVFAAKSDASNVGGGSIDGQKMVKMAIEFLRRISRLQLMSSEAGRPATSSNQSHHTMSERRRREKLNESFDALRMLLPQGSKKDKASVLANTKNYLRSLEVEISELKERNRLLEIKQKLQPQDKYKEIGDSKDRVQVHIGRASESTSETLEINLTIIVREEHCNVIDVLLGVCESLRTRGNTTLVSAEGSTARSPQTNVCMEGNIILQVKTSGYNEESFKAAVIDAVNGVLARSANLNT